MSGRKISPRGQRRGHQILAQKYETSINDKLSEFTVENESDTNMKYTSTPLKKNVGINRLRRQASAPANFESEESTDAVKSQPRHLKRRKSSRDMRRGRNAGKKLISDADRGDNRRRKSRRRGSEGDKNDVAIEEDEDADESRASRRLKRDKNPRRQVSELPIAEVLRNAQENQKNVKTRYEDPLPMPELTTDTVYVQGRNGFSAVKIGKFRNEKNYSEQLLKPIHVAIKVHGSSKTVMFFCQGLLGGLALGQVILAPMILGEINATNYPQLISAIFLFLITMSLVATMDSIDLGYLDLENMREIFSRHFMTIVTFPLYLIAMCIHLVTMMDEQNFTYVDQQSPRESNVVGKPTSHVITENQENFTPRQTYTWKFVICIIAWFCIALGPTDDMTTSHLEAMQKYAT